MKTTENNKQQYSPILSELGLNKQQTKQYLLDHNAKNIRYCGHTKKKIKNEKGEIETIEVKKGFYYN